MPNTRKIYDDVYYLVKRNTVTVCEQCHKKMLINTQVYAKGSQSSEQIFCRECTTRLSDQYQYEVFGRVPFPNDVPLYIGLIGHPCSQLLGDYSRFPAIFRSKGRFACLSVRHCPQCDRYFIEQKDYQNNTHVLSAYSLIHTATGKPMPCSRQSVGISYSDLDIEPEFAPSVVWSYKHPFQGGGCSGK